MSATSESRIGQVEVEGRSGKQQAGQGHAVVVVTAVTVALVLGIIALILRLLAHPFAFTELGHTVVAVRPMRATAVMVGDAIVAAPPLPAHAHAIEQIVAAIQRARLHGHLYVVVETRAVDHRLFPWREVLPATVYRIVSILPTPIAVIYRVLHAHTALLEATFALAILGIVLLALSTAHLARSLIQQLR